MDLNHLTKEELIHQNQELKKEINALKTRYVWGLEVDDFASAAIGTDGTPIKDSEIFTKEELSDDELRYQAFYALREIEKYSPHEWYEDISVSSNAFSEHTMKLLRTASKRWLTYE